MWVGVLTLCFLIKTSLEEMEPEMFSTHVLTLTTKKLEKEKVNVLLDHPIYIFLSARKEDTFFTACSPVGDLHTHKLTFCSRWDMKPTDIGPKFLINSTILVEVSNTLQQFFNVFEWDGE